MGGGRTFHRQGSEDIRGLGCGCLAATLTNFFLIASLAISTHVISFCPTFPLATHHPVFGGGEGEREGGGYPYASVWSLFFFPSAMGLCDAKGCVGPKGLRHGLRWPAGNERRFPGSGPGLLLKPRVPHPPSVQQ